MNSVRSCQKFPPCLTEKMPAGSKTDPALAKAEPINDSGITSGIKYLRSEKMSYTTASGREEVEYVRCRQPGQCRRSRCSRSRS